VSNQKLHKRDAAAVGLVLPNAGRNMCCRVLVQALQDLCVVTSVRVIGDLNPVREIFVIFFPEFLRDINGTVP
jgi:hypothetical protein